MTPFTPRYIAAARTAIRRVRAGLRRARGPGSAPQPPGGRGADATTVGLARYSEGLRSGLTPAVAGAESARECLGANNLAAVLRLGYVLLQKPATAQPGHAVLGLARARTSGPAQAWAEFAELQDLDAIAAVGEEYFPAGFAVDPATATAVASALVEQRQSPELPAAAAVTIARHAFAAGEEDLVRGCLAAAEQGRLASEAAAELQLLADWLPDGARRRAIPAVDADFRFGVLDHRQPAYRSRNLGDYIQSLAGLGLLVRHRGLRAVGDPELVDLATELSGRIKPGREVAGRRTVVQLVELQREATTLQPLPEPTWAFMAGWYSHPTLSGGWDLPFHPALRPILLSFHLANPETLTPAVIEYLRHFGPVGARDWQTVALLRAAGVPSFFSGCISVTVDTVFPDADQSARVRTAFIDPQQLTRVDAKGDVIDPDGRDIRSEPLAANLRRAVDWVERYHTVYSDVVTSRLHSYLPARAVGCRVRFEPANPSDVCYGGLLELDDLQFDALRAGLLHKTGAVIDLLAKGADEDAVYARWRELCADDVAEAERFLGAFSLTEHALPTPSVPAPPGSRLVVVDAPVRSDRGTSRLLKSLAEHAPDLPVVVVGPGAGRADGVRWIRDLAVPERGSAHQQQALLVASVLGSLPSGVRALLLPSEAIVRGPLDALFEVELDGAVVAARGEVRRGRRDLSTMLRRIAIRQAQAWQDALGFLAAAHARCGHGATAFDPRVAVIDVDALRASGFAELARELIEEFGASLGEALNLVLRGRHASLTPAQHSNVSLETPEPGATIISGLSQARMGAHWFA